MTNDESGRPISFVFAGATSEKDGATVRLDAQRLRASVNYRQMREGFAYPLYYNTLFAALRRELDRALADARSGKRGLWTAKTAERDASLSGVSVRKLADLETIRPMWTKLWRRLEEFYRKQPSGPLSAFIDFLEQKNERIDVLSVMEERGLQDLVEVRAGNKVRLVEPPENLRVVGKAGERRR